MLFSDASGEISKNPPAVSFLDHGFLFGDSLYEVVRTYGRKLWTWDEHMARLRQSGQRVGLSIESLEADIRGRALSLLKALNVDNAAVRIIVTRGIGKLHIDPRTCDHPLVYMAAWGLDVAALRSPVRLFVPTIRRMPKATLDPAIKSGNYLNNVLAFREAVQAGYDDALLLNVAGEVTEATTSNIAWIKDKTIFTPHTDCGILHGITRAELLKQRDLVQGHFTVDDLMGADEVFLLSTFKEILPVDEIKSHDGRLWRSHSHQEVLKLYDEFSKSLVSKLAETGAHY